MQIYKTTNQVTGKFYIGKEQNPSEFYLGSGKLLKKAIEKHGRENFTKEILETCSSIDELNEREKYWIDYLGALGNQGYNMAIGGTGGDLSKFIDYEKRGYKSDRFAGRQQWWNNLTKQQQSEIYERQANSRSKGWYVSKIDNPEEEYVLNISKWCEENNVDKSMPTSLNNPNHRLYQKQTKGWRIRRSDMPKLPPYENRRGKVVVDNNCKGKTWKIIDGKRVWINK